MRLAAWGGVAALGLVLLATAGGWLVTDGPLGRGAGGRAVATGPASLPIGGPFRMTDAATGREVTEADFRGRPMAVFFGFAHCPDVCPTALTDMAGWMAALGEADAARVRWVFASVDPARDTPGALREYMKAFDPRIAALTGTEAQVAAMARAWRVVYRRAPTGPGPDDYTMDHSASVFLHDAAGRFAGTVDPEEPERAALEKLRLLAARAG